MHIFLLIGLLFLSHCDKSDKKQKKHPQQISAQAVIIEPEDTIETPGQYFLSRFDDVKYKKDFKHLFYVNPNAPKGGTLRLATVGTFDKINKFMLKGRAAEGLDNTFDKLMYAAKDEAFSKYGLIIKTCEISPDNSHIIFHIRPQARFHDGTPVTADDIKRTVEYLKKDGILPAYKRVYSSRTERIETRDPHTVVFYFAPDEKGKYDPLLPLAIANLTPVAPISGNTLADNVLTPIVSTGPYMVKDFRLGQGIRFKKTPGYWANALPITKGRWNFDEVHITYFKTDRSYLEAFKKGDFDVFFFSDPQAFESFQCPDHRFTKLDFKHKLPVMVQTIALNQSNPVLQDQRVRDALNFIISFKDINRVCFGNTALYARSLFENTGLGHKGHPDTEEQKIWEQLKNKLNPEFYNRLMQYDVNYFTKGGKGARVEIAEKLLDEAGYKYDKHLGYRVNSKGQKLTFDFIIRQSRAKFSRFLNVFKINLEKIGITLNIVMLEETIYRQREDAGAYDMMILPYTMEKLPGVELIGYFGKVSGMQRGSYNYMNLVDDIAENLANGVIRATNKVDMGAHVKALDRYLCLRGYLILLDYNNSLQLVYRNDRIDFPKNPLAGIDIWEQGWSVCQ
jgi:microcin C transport system substrate-binding protein